MELLSMEELALLIESPGDPAVSIYMPTHRTGDIQQDPIRLKNLLRDAEDQLVGYGIRAAEARRLLEPARGLLTDTHFWQYQGDGLAVFVSPDTSRHYRLPHSFKEVIVVTERFHVKPLVPLFAEDGVFYVLAVSQNRARLLQCTRYHALEVTPETVPSSLAEALRYDDPEKQQQFRTTGRAGTTLFHGQGASKDYDKDAILRYFHQVDRGIHGVLGGDRNPLVIAAVDYLHSIYREANSYRHLLKEGIEANPDDLSEQQLQQQAWPIVQPYFERGRTAAVEEYHEEVTKGLAGSDVTQTVLAAYDGRVATLFVATDAEQWGRFDREARRVDLYEERQPGLEDLLDFAVVHTLTKKGAVYSVPAGEVPGGGAIAAIFRY